MDKKKLAADFNFVAAHFDLGTLGELEEAKQVVRDDPENAAISFAAMAGEITGAIYAEPDRRGELMNVEVMA